MTFQQRESGVWVYPRSVWRKFAWRVPLLLWRMGLGWLFRALPMLVLTTRGKKSGHPRHVMIECSSINGKIYVTPGWGKRTQWYRNIAADPHVTVQRKGEVFAATAVRVTDANELSAVFQYVHETSPMWKPFLNSWGIEDNLQDFLSKHDRIVALRFDRSEVRPPLPSLRVDLWWVWLVLAALGAILLGAGER
jgi:deazaflavin-dependent oxidoreductase (nitroreductase family)